MSKLQRTTTDVTWCAIVVVPLVAFGGMFAASAPRWQTEKSKLKQSIQEIVGDGNTLDYSTMPRRYDEFTSKEFTATWKSILSASEVTTQSSEVRLHGRVRRIPTRNWSRRVKNGRLRT